jgi:hypothetical protein
MKSVKTLEAKYTVTKPFDDYKEIAAGVFVSRDQPPRMWPTYLAIAVLLPLVLFAEAMGFMFRL